MRRSRGAAHDGRREASALVECAGRAGAFESGGMSAALQKPAQFPEVLPVRLVLDLLRRLDQLRDAPEADVVEDVAEALDADLALADVLVTVDARAERLLRVVEMERADPGDTDVGLDLVDGALPPIA